MTPVRLGTYVVRGWAGGVSATLAYLSAVLDRWWTVTGWIVVTLALAVWVLATAWTDLRARHVARSRPDR
ncbi:hypothetical protein [Actinomycetospora aeridis]|uniref:Uncharacterized protein n=1 Tax=Actinomycetospora aeridis TaxID=3129231 RepID=A0ABU8N3C1_9PSEU